MDTTTETFGADHATKPAPHHSAALLDVASVAALLAVSARSVRRMADSGAMPRPLKLGSLIRWRKADVDAWLAAGCPSCRPGRGAGR